MPIKSQFPDLNVPEIPIHDCLFASIKSFGNSEAMIENETGRSITFKEIYTQSRKCAAALYKLGLKKGEVVGLCAPSCIEYAVIFLATASCGAVLTTVNSEYHQGEILQMFEISKPCVVFSHESSVENIQTVCARLGYVKHIFAFGESNQYSSYKDLVVSGIEDDFPVVKTDPKKDVVYMPYSSGTTGLPKCVMHSHYSLLSTLFTFQCGLLDQDYLNK